MLDFLNLKHTLLKLAHDKRLLWGINILLILLILLTSFQFALAIRATTMAEFVLEPKQFVAAIQKKYNIAALHLFGEYKNIQSKALPKTKLNLSLQAIFFSKAHPEKSGALIAEGSQDAKLYHEGEKLSNITSIKEILPNEVVIDHAGDFQKLTLPIPELKFAPAPENTLSK